MSGPLILYNLFPRLVGSFDRWDTHLARAQALGFNAVYVNPIHLTGLSGSLYAVKDHRRIDPAFLPSGQTDGLAALRPVLVQAQQLGLRPILDLVVNHTAIDAVLTQSHPQWFKRDPTGALVHPSAIDPADARRVTVWGDLADVDNAGSPDRPALWAYWAELVRELVALGIRGFRCDAAYHVPTELWRHLIAAARAVHPDVLFLAETLGCTTEQVLQFRGVGFNYLFNSAKWWNYDAPWCLRQHSDYASIAPSVGFPESHDTPRLAAETGGLDRVARQRYAFVAAFSAGVMAPVGFEFGFRNGLDVVRTAPADWEAPSYDLSDFLRQVHDAKTRLEALGGEGHVDALTSLDLPTLVLRKVVGRAAMLIVVNKDWHHGQTAFIPDAEAALGAARPVLLRVCRPGAPIEAPSAAVALEPAEVVYVLPAAAALRESAPTCG